MTRSFGAVAVLAILSAIGGGAMRAQAPVTGSADPEALFVFSVR